MPASDALHALFANAPANQTLGMQLVSAAPNNACVELPVRPGLIQEKGVVHGGFLATLADTAAVYALLSETPEDGNLASIEFKVNFLAPGRAAGGPLRAASRVVRRGRTVAVVAVDISQDDVAVATGLFTYIQSQP